MTKQHKNNDFLQEKPLKYTHFQHASQAFPHFSSPSSYKWCMCLFCTENSYYWNSIERNIHRNIWSTTTLEQNELYCMLSVFLICTIRIQTLKGYFSEWVFYPTCNFAADFSPQWYKISIWKFACLLKTQCSTTWQSEIWNFNLFVSEKRLRNYFFAKNTNFHKFLTLLPW